MKRILVTCAAASLTVGGFAQNLDTTAVTDQFTAGFRSDQVNGSPYSAPTYPEITGTINYTNTFRDGADEAPVLNVTTTQTLATESTIPPVVANTGDTSSTSNANALYIGDGGGGNNAVFGSLTSANYTIKTAFYCDGRTLSPPDTDPLQGYERTYITVRCPGDTVGAGAGSGSNCDAIGGYGLCYETDNRKAYMIKWNNTFPTILGATVTRNRDASTSTILAQSGTLTNGWHRFELSAQGTTISAKVDGVSIGSVSDSTYAAGFAGLCYREAFTNAAEEHQGRFDYVMSVPPPVPAAAQDWKLFE